VCIGALTYFIGGVTGLLILASILSILILLVFAWGWWIVGFPLY
jgi:hypothetical protein